ncbi:hypothetical protein BDR26DRAFT_918465 [Obelidium mucronatum]|nr:hypothetical protein BDR26DRAFT_918465 [Obelidium mucronatum]
MVVLWVSLDGKLKLQAEKTAGQDLITIRIQELKKENSEQEMKKIQYMRAICNKYIDASGSPAIQDSNEMLPNRCASDILEYLLYLELKSKKLAIQSVATDLEDLLSTRIEGIYNMYKERGIKFKHEFNTMFDWIRVDPVRIEQVVLNVLMGPMQHLNPSNTLASTITIKSVTSNDEESTLAYFMEFVIHICGVTNIYSFKTKFERLLQHSPFQAASEEFHIYQNQEPLKVGPEKQQHQEISIDENGHTRLDETSISQDTLRLSSTNTVSSPFHMDEGKSAAAAATSATVAVSGDGHQEIRGFGSTQLVYPDLIDWGLGKF